MSAFVKFEDLTVGDAFHSNGINYHKVQVLEEMVQNCTQTHVNASHRSKGVVQFVHFDEATLVLPGHVDYETLEVRKQQRRVVSLFGDL